ncbi:sulfotransferase family 5A, member 1 [Alosa alosa]|uniref:sulfotransferase family 5A, member 1 n=1 Tax=Alosa alosa TaxID=278164 RepID=UPI0020152A75|nr:sulfotransferase family 5A, member 1 [Alosa alosa]
MSRLDVTETFHGISLPGHLHTKDSLNYATQFPFQDSDTLIVSYPKSGTTWMQEMVTLILSRGDPTPSQTVPNWARAPWLEQYYCPQVLSAAQGPRVLTTHLPYHTLAPALRGSKTRVIYIARNPRDVAVSYYHFHHMAKFLPEPGSFEEFLNNFLEGKVHYGSWFNHVKGWTDPKKDIENFFFITYEEMLKDLRGSLQRVSSFLQCPLQEEEINRAQEQCSFSTMKDNDMVNYKLVTQDIMDHSRGKFMRKGKSGDWRNTFHEYQSRDFDAVYEAQMQESHLKLMWTSTDTQMQESHLKLMWTSTDTQMTATSPALTSPLRPPACEMFVN